jgi:ABC-type multidrug transport system permease subunit
MVKYRPLNELMKARAKEFFREPEVIFWVYIFPILLMVGLGIAFRTESKEEIRVDVAAGPLAESVRSALAGSKEVRVEVIPLDPARKRYATGKVDLIIEPRDGAYHFLYDPSRGGAEAAKIKVNDLLQAAAGRKDPIAAREELITEPGSRYVDWLIPGLMGMNIMGGGLWGLGFVTVDLRMRKLLKRFVATPMKRSDFLIALMASRLLFLVPEMVAILLVGHLLFGLQIKGSLTTLSLVALLGALSFSGLGLLVGCRTEKIEVVSGLLNVVMLPMWLLSGIFFSSQRFPDAMQPFVQALPLTQLNNALRAIILEGAPVTDQWLPVLLLSMYGAVSFTAALRWFRWQ